MRRPLVIATAVVLAAVLAGASFLLGVRVGSRPEFDPVVATAEEIRARAAEPVALDDLIRGAVRGMLDVLDDPYAAFLDPGRAAEAEELTSGSYVGIGMWLDAPDGGLRVASVLEGSPAAEAGILPGDLVLRVDGRAVAGLSARDAGVLLGGPEGSRVTLMVDSAEGRREVTLTRSRISLGRVEGRMLEGGIGYLRPLRFARGVARAAGEELRGLVDEGATGVVLDLRGNPGGLTEEAVDVAGLFLGGEVVARVHERGRERELRSDVEAVTSLPAAVLVDGGTASAAEMVAGALQDHGRATLVGTPTFGKGMLLAVSHVEDTGGAVRFATGTFVTPEGHGIEGTGLAPDVGVLPGGPIDAQLDRAVHLLRGEA